MGCCPSSGPGTARRTKRERSRRLAELGRAHEQHVGDSVPAATRVDPVADDDRGGDQPEGDDDGADALGDLTRAGDVKHSEADIGRAVDLLGYETLVGVEEGIRRTIDWYRDFRRA